MIKSIADALVMYLVLVMERVLYVHQQYIPGIHSVYTWYKTITYTYLV